MLHEGNFSTAIINFSGVGFFTSSQEIDTLPSVVSLVYNSIKSDQVVCSMLANKPFDQNLEHTLHGCMSRKSKSASPFLDNQEYVGFIYGEQRWRSRDRKRIYTWDSLHGEIEVFNTRGYHLGVLDKIEGRLIKSAVKGRRIRV